MESVERRGAAGGHHRGRTSRGRRPDQGPARLLSELARSLEAESDVRHTLDGIVRAATVSTPGARHAGITRVLRNRRLVTVAASDELVNAVDELQFTVDQGPCLDSIRDEITVRPDDLHTEIRWPDFAARAVELGIVSMLSFQLFVQGHELGALNLYGVEPDAFDDADEQIGLLLASHVAIAMMGAQMQQNLNVALTTRDRIGRAKGILMERHRITDEQAFDLLPRASRNTNRKLLDIAEEVAGTGQEPAG